MKAVVVCVAISLCGVNDAISCEMHGAAEAVTGGLA